VLSLLPLVRPNYLLVWICAVSLILWVQYRNRFETVLASPRRLLAASLLFFIPSALWVMRNYLVSGAFPVLAGSATTTLYGNYNPVSAKPGPRFGRWVDPRRLPGEIAQDTLFRSWTEAQMLKHYDEQAKAFINQNWNVVPRLVAVHVAHVFTPIPEDGAHKYSFWIYRLVLYALAVWALAQESFRLRSWFAVMIAATIMVSAISVLLYNGEGRYLYPLNILLLALVFSTQFRFFANLRVRRAGHRT